MGERLTGLGRERGDETRGERSICFDAKKGVDEGVEGGVEEGDEVGENVEAVERWMGTT